MADRNPPIYLFDLPPRCVKSMIFGVRFTEKWKRQLIKEVRHSQDLQHIAILQAKMNDQEFTLIFEPI